MAAAERELDLTVDVRGGQYQVRGRPGYGEDWPPPQDGVTTGEGHWVAVLTGTEWGPVGVRIRVLAAQPADVDDGWAVVVERDLHAESHPLVISTLYTEEADDIPVAPAGTERFRLRVHVRQRDEAAAIGDTDTAVEQHLIQLWESQAAAPGVVYYSRDQQATLFRPATDG